MAQKYTRNMIRNVFIEMLDERPFDEITVTDLVTRCEINRKTFYYYYQDLYAVLTEIFESELETVLGGVKEHVTWGRASHRRCRLPCGISAPSTT